MAVHSYNDLRAHIGHKIACACYGTKIDHPDNIAVECEDCGVVLMDFDREPEEIETSHWDNDPDYPPEDWQYEVANGDTRLGYREWVEHKKEEN